MPDENQKAEKAVHRITESEPVDGAELIGDPETRRKFLEVKEREEARKAETTKSK